MAENTSLTTEEQRLAEERYRFSAFRYGFRGPDACGSDQIIPQDLGLFAYPKNDEGNLRDNSE